MSHVVAVPSEMNRALGGSLEAQIELSRMKLNRPGMVRMLKTTVFQFHLVKEVD